MIVRSSSVLDEDTDRYSVPTSIEPPEGRWLLDDAW
jgi:hypothetical protein